MGKFCDVFLVSLIQIISEFTKRDQIWIGSSTMSCGDICGDFKQIT